MPAFREEQSRVNRLGNQMPRPRPINPFTKTYDKISTPTLLDPGLFGCLQIERDSIKLGLVSFKLTESFSISSQNIAEDSSPELNHNAFYRSIVTSTDTEARKLFKNYESALLLAVKECEADVICVNELGFPSVNGQPLPEAIEFSSNLATTQNCLIVAGSYHDGLSFYNTGHIYCPDCEGHGPKYHKQISATEEGEFITVPPQRPTVSFPTFGLTISVVVCLDLLDYSTIAAVFRPEYDVDLLLVPSYSSYSGTMNRIARDASEVMPGGVIIVNRNRGPDPSCSLFFFGDRIPESEYTTIDLPNNAGTVTIYDIDINQFRRLKHTNRWKGNSDLKWLFGRPFPQRR